MPKEMKELRASLRRHKRVLTVLSAAIVLISFTLKEELAEHLRKRLAVFDGVQTQIDKNTERSFPSEFLVDQKLTQVIALLQRLNKIPDEEWREKIMEQPLLAKNRIDEQMYDVIAVARISAHEEYYKANVRRIWDDRRKPFDALVVIVHGSALTPDAQNELREIDKQMSAVEHGADGLQDEAFKEFLGRKKRLEIGTAILNWSVYILFCLWLDAWSHVGTGWKSTTIPTRVRLAQFEGAPPTKRGSPRHSAGPTSDGG